MIVFEALQALQGDCLLLTLPSAAKGSQRWLIDGGPGAGPRAGWKNAAGPDATTRIAPWRQVLLPHLGWDPDAPETIVIDLGVCTHVDDDHIAGMVKLVEKAAGATPTDPAPIEFRAFWFNSLSAVLLGAPSIAATQAIGATIAAAFRTTGALPSGAVPAAAGAGWPTGSPQAVALSVPQGASLESALEKLRLGGNPPFVGPVRSGRRTAAGGARMDFDGVAVTVLGPSPDRLEKLRKEWQKAVAEKDVAKRAAAVADLSTRAKDGSWPNLSSIVLLVEAEGRRLLLTGDGLAEDILAAWRADPERGDQICPLDVLKLPHHGSWRNVSKEFLEVFPADHYVFSANGKDDNPDPPTIELIVATFADRPFTLHFTNGDVEWSKAYELDRPNSTTGKRETVRTLPDLLVALRAAYGGTWTTTARSGSDRAVRIELAAKP
ncbi:MAG: hypothetical protein LWW93_12305 [Hyphomicrobiales bacterium]|nr:hypothetical protein [Hyphomicrobiales bacterium]